jgi:phage terminase Nu1 subunit (DNA packaging protein)
MLANLLSDEQLEEITKVKRRTWQDWRLRGLGPAYIKVGRLVRYDPQTVAQWLASRTVATAEQTGERR